ncbi:gas vesicle protein GvpG [Mycobacterium sp. 1164985.4]|uniref:gas vesicle protein GvpG n=1 Tax=Mycobacterium sp. 1164985.4 TaxID=1834069 RepID=UPI0007FD6060|nr:gas vesicle protein GvpG [Mycobacterium sp. 1164985.4]OBK76111.1 gas vesicle protein G [Mycobacterium sp. 1164985.4]
MGIFSALVTWPLLPVRGVISLGELIERQVNAELNDPARTRRQLEELEDARRRGEISAEEEREAQEQILATRIGQDAGTTPEEDG